MQASDAASMHLPVMPEEVLRLLNVSLFRDMFTDRQLKAGAVLMKAPRKLGDKKKGEVDETRVQSEREWVRSMSGEEGVKAYDELVAMREARWAREKAEREAKERGEGKEGVEGGG